MHAPVLPGPRFLKHRWACAQENVPEALDAPSEFWHDVGAGQVFLRPPAGVSDPTQLTDLVAVTAQRVLDIGRRTSAGVAPIQVKNFD